MATNRRVLMQDPNDSAKWEALEYLANDPTNYWRTPLDTAGAEKYQQKGGFSIVEPQAYNAELSGITDAIRKRNAPAPVDTNTLPDSAFSMPRNAAESVALLNQQAGREGVGPQVVADMADLEQTARAAPLGLARRSSPSADPELAQRIAHERMRDAGGGDDLAARIARERLRDAEGSARSAALRKSAPQPRISVGAAPGDMPSVRVHESLRAPGAPETAEGVATKALPPSPAGSSGDVDFASAQDDARQRALAVALSRAGARASEAISGVGGDMGAYDALAKETDSPVRELLARREADKRKSLEDPTSEQSKRIQAWVSKALPGVYSPEELAAITAADADSVTRYGEMRQRLDQRAGEVERLRTQRADDLAREDRVREDEQTFRATEAQKDRDLRREVARRRGGPSAAQTAAAQNRLEADVQKAGGDLEGAGTLASDLDLLDQMAAREDIPGVGRWDSKKTGLLSMFASDDDTRVMQTMRSVVGRMIAERSGKAASDAEVERVMAELGMSPGASEQEFRVGVKRLRQDVANALSTKQARYRPEVIQTYRERGGKTAQDIAPGRPAVQSQSDDVKMIAPNGQERMVPRARVQEAIAAGGRVVNG